MGGFTYKKVCQLFPLNNSCFRVICSLKKIFDISNKNSWFFVAPLRLDCAVILFIWKFHGQSIDFYNDTFIFGHICNINNSFTCGLQTSEFSKNKSESWRTRRILEAYKLLTTSQIFFFLKLYLLICRYWSSWFEFTAEIF